MDGINRLSRIVYLSYLLLHLDLRLLIEEPIRDLQVSETYSHHSKVGYSLQF